MRIERVLAPNPGVFTGPGTNTYLVGDERLLIIDPGPIEVSHHQAILQAVGTRPVDAVIVTHTHPDHAPLANPLARDLGVPAMGHEPGPEFDPDLRLADGDVVRSAEVEFRVVHTPGHSADHLCLLADGSLFTGDHIMGGSSVMVEDLVPYLQSLERLQTLELDRIYPGHGPEMDRPQEVISWYLAHRRQREREIVAAIRAGAGTVGAVLETVYDDVDRALHPLAARSVAAHLRKLVDDGVVWVAGIEWDSPLGPVDQ